MLSSRLLDILRDYWNRTQVWRLTTRRSIGGCSSMPRYLRGNSVRASVQWVAVGQWTRPYGTVKGVWKYLYRAVDKSGATVDFLLTAKRESM